MDENPSQPPQEEPVIRQTKPHLPTWLVVLMVAAVTFFLGFIGLWLLDHLDDSATYYLSDEYQSGD